MFFIPNFWKMAFSLTHNQAGAALAKPIAANAPFTKILNNDYYGVVDVFASNTVQNVYLV